MKKIDLSLYLVLDPTFFKNTEAMLRTAIDAVKNGVSIVQLRAKQLDKKSFYQLALDLKQQLDKLETPLIINDHIDVALAVDAAGVHIGQKDLPANISRELLGKQKLLGLSISNAEELSLVDKSIVDYLGIGPVFYTNSKMDAEPALGLSLLAKLMNIKPCPCVAIGGINEQNVAQVMRCNVDGVAVISAICGQKSPDMATRNLLQKLRIGGQKTRKNTS